MGQVVFMNKNKDGSVHQYDKIVKARCDFKIGRHDGEVSHKKECCEHPEKVGHDQNQLI